MDEIPLVDLRWRGVKMILAGIVFLVLGVLIITLDIPTPGGHYYGSQGQSVVSISALGCIMVLVGYLVFQGKT